MKKTFTKLIAALALLVFMMPSLAGWGQSYDLITDVDDITDGDYVIAANVNGTYYALSNTFAGQISGTAITVTSESISTTDANGYVVTIAKDNNNRISISNGTNYLCCKSSGTSFDYNGTTAYYHNVTYNTNNGGGFLIKHQSATRGVIYRAGTTQKFGNYSTGNVNGSEYYYVQLFKYNSGGGTTVSAPTFELLSGETGQYLLDDDYVMLDCETSGATIYYTMGDNPEDPTNASTAYDPDNGIELNATATIKAIAYVGEDHSSVASQTYYFPSTITEARAQSQNSTVYTIGTVTSIAGSSAYIQDESAAINVYGDNTLVVGKKYAVKGTLTNYSNLLEITNPTCTEVTGGTVIAPEVMTIASILSSTNQGWFIKIEGATVGTTSNGNTTLTQSGSSIVARNISGTYTQGDVINLTGNISVYNSTKQIANPIVVVGPTIEADPTSLSFTYVAGGSADAKTFTVAGDNLEDDITITLSGNNFAMSADGTNWSQTTLSIAEATAIGDIQVRFNSGITTIGTYNGTITLSSEGADDVEVSLTGTVTTPTHTIEQYSTPATAHGTITFSPESPVAQGTTVTLTAEPTEGYEFTANSWVFYNASTLEPVTLAVTDGNTITMPTYDLAVDGTFTAKPTYDITCAINPTGVAEMITDATQDKAYEGQTVILTIDNVNTEYSFSNIVITKTSDGSATGITVTPEGEGFKFTMPGYPVTATANFVSMTYEGSFVQYSGDLTEGDYLLVYNNEAMNDTLTNSKLGVTEVGSGNVISNPSRAIVWHIAQSKIAGYWTIYNAVINRYVCAGSKTNVGLANDTTDNSAKWKVVGTYDFQCKINEGESTTRYLRNNGGVFGNYASNNGGALTLYKYTTLTERTITYNGNGGSTGTGNTEYTQTVYDGIAAALTANQFTKTNAAFAGWAETASGEVAYADGANITVTGGDKTLYAKWVQSYTATVDSQIENGSVYIVTATTNVTTTTVAEGTEITLTYTANQGYAFSAWNVYYMESGEPVAVTVTDNKFNMPAHDVTISAGFAEVATYSLVTSINDLVSGKHYIIASSATAGSAYAMGAQKYNAQNVQTNRNGVPVTVSSSNNSVYITEEEGVYEFVINGPEMITKNNESIAVYTIYDAQFPGYLYAGSSSANYLNTQSFNNANGQWTIAIANTGSATIKAQGSNTRNCMRSNGNLFACYTSGQSDIYLYVKDNDTNYDFYKDIAAYTQLANDTVNGVITYSNGWNFIASPLASAYPLTGTDMVSGTGYDLYRLNNTMWENYNNDEHSDFTALNSGTGYLYANSNNITLHFSGAINEFTTEGGANVKSLSEGWNLIGNPYNIPIYIDKAYYKMNADGNDVELGNTSVAIPACTGVVVKSNGSENVTFSTSAPDHSTGNNGSLQMALVKANMRGNAVQDKAVVSFNEGIQLGKFIFNENNAKLFIPQNGEDYAIAFSNRQSDVPVCFKTKELGTYTINFSGEDVELDGMYLVDILEGRTIDLSVNPSYTFIGSPSDRQERFRIKFGENANAISDMFAYQNGNDIIVNGEGELQVFDVTGRMVMSAMVNGIETINGLENGVYVFRMVGNDVKTQKIVIR